MQTKTIEKNIKAKLEEWLLSITDESLRKEVRKNVLVSGGCVASMFLNETVNDYDVYMMNMDVCKKLAVYYTKAINEPFVILDGRLKESFKVDLSIMYKGEDVEAINNSYAIALRNLKPEQIKLFFNHTKGGIRVNDDIEREKLHYQPLFFSPNAISLSNNLQIVLRFCGTPEQIHKTFDFVHATNYFTFETGLVRNLAAVESILTKQLKYQGSFYPVTSVIRAKKFVKRGFNISAGELLKIMFQISEFDLSNPDILDEQLIGVDVAYFDLIIRALRDKYESDKEFKITTAYFNELIDRIFGGSDDIEIN